MSNIYIQEPSTSGKVVLNTTVGAIEIELWAREAPKACRNFVQLCMEGYYDGTIFHRVMKEFIAQGGDPTGTGKGGESIYSRTGKPWREEFHSRLRFVRRGLVATADKGSQFFFTLGEGRELQNKHTIFGKVAGDTIYNMIRLEQCDTDAEGRPEFPQKIISAKVVDNPFKDLDEEEIAARRRSADAVKAEIEENVKKPKKKGSKNFKLLSFGDEAEAEEADNTSIAQTSKNKSKSFHDLGDDPNMISTTAIPVKTEPSSPKQVKEEIKPPKEIKMDFPKVKEEREAGDSDDESFESKMRDKVKRKLEKAAKDKFGDREKEVGEKRPRRWDATEVTAAKRSEVNEKAKKPEGEEDLGDDEYSLAKKAKKGLEPRARQAKGASREAETLKLLAKFKSKLDTLPADEDEKVEDLTDAEGDVKGDGWMAQELHFSAGDPTLAKDASTKGDDWYEIFDPRNPINKRRREAEENAKKKQTNKKSN